MQENKRRKAADFSLPESALVKQLLRGLYHQDGSVKDVSSWTDSISHQIALLLKDPSGSGGVYRELISCGRVALQAFLQASVTGPPLSWTPADVLLPQDVLTSLRLNRTQAQERLRSSLTIDGEAVYRLLPHVELFAFASCVLNHDEMFKTSALLRWRLRVNCWHQRLLSDLSPTLQARIYEDLHLLEHFDSAEFFIERATIDLLHGLDTRAQLNLKKAKEKRGFEYALTGRLGKRTKFQDRELSQLVVLATSAEQNEPKGDDEDAANPTLPSAVNLEDDTLLEKVAFSRAENGAADILSDDELPRSLASLDVSNQPMLQPLDCIILLATASSITNTSPADGLTREETLPYADRVIAGGSSNWQVYTEALHVRSRIEAFKSRTAERGVLQLQSLVDQVVAEIETKSSDSEAHGEAEPSQGTNTFLPKPTASNAASAEDRLQCIHHLGSPPIWKLEAELADRWVSLGALRTALDIYERLELWAELALCWAATDREDNALSVLRKQLYDIPKATSDGNDLPAGPVENQQLEKNPLPPDAPRLFCILGDITTSMHAYERAWEVSNHRYARAQRSIGKLYLAERKLKEADMAYAASLKVNPQNHATWFALGCIRLELESWQPAVDAFSRAIQIEESDAETWSNLAVALLHANSNSETENAKEERSKGVKEAFNALKRAATLKRDSFRIWQNLMNVAIKLEPPPYSDIIVAQTRLIELLGPTEGERCVDTPIMEALLADTIRIGDEEMSSEGRDGKTGQPIGLKKMVSDLINKKITPLITSSRRLWVLTAKLCIYQRRPHAALSAYEKAWRSELNQPAWDSAYTAGSKKGWLEVVESTTDLMDAYESLGEKTRESGLSEGELVAKDWKFKARSAARTVLSRAKVAWEDDEAYGRLQQRLQDLKAG